MIDFHRVDEGHFRIDERLRNWARWVIPRRPSWVHPMWRQYRSSEVWGAESGVPVDGLDAQLMEKQVSALPDRHRDAVRWAYVYRKSPHRIARHLGVSLDGLHRLVHEARQMLVNRT